MTLKPEIPATRNHSLTSGSSLISIAVIFGTILQKGLILVEEESSTSSSITLVSCSVCRRATANQQIKR
ncbi:hypothetical protein AXX17_AT4G42190 [Arabidopsis thaliana]|uniref:Uncharacterized protein n=1 Tax=Arabidopsis thaliana TaxID=3702 RepID=A0A178V3T1_ARATH|nr:hypothetical protein AXX17_AT4G42190 [Arabidopsis thaliana]